MLIDDQKMSNTNLHKGMRDFSAYADVSNQLHHAPTVHRKRFYFSVMCINIPNPYGLISSGKLMAETQIQKLRIANRIIFSDFQV